MAIDQFALIQGARQAEADNMARARFDVEQATRQNALAQNRQTWDLAYPQAQMSAEQNMARMAAEVSGLTTRRPSSPPLPWTWPPRRSAWKRCAHS